MPDLKLGSNWKSCGYLYDMRRWAHGNGRINFGFCKGDDNFGGCRRKELDDFCKSLGKQMNLVMYRMQDTENLRMRIRERNRASVRDKARNEEVREKYHMDRLEKNRKWRDKKLGKGTEDEDEKEMDENEKRKEKNREWREKRSCKDKIEEEVSETSSLSSNSRFDMLMKQISQQLLCSICDSELDTKILQCEEGHGVCSLCREKQESPACALCDGEFIGRNKALEELAKFINRGMVDNEVEFEENVREIEIK